MSLDSRFIITSDLQSLFRDKDSGLPLRNGVVYFWSDLARTTPKPVYKISGTPPNYIYTALANPITLTSAGTFSDGSNNDIVPYYFPYDGTPDNTNENVELYYIEVYSEGGKASGVQQFTREGWPNFTLEETDQGVSVNYVPNGQFLIHSDIPADDINNFKAGQIRQAITVLTQGGWTFERPGSTTATDFVTFDRIGGYTIAPTASPRYKVTIQTTVPNSGDTFKDLRLKFDDVNKFASLTQEYTFGFWGQSNAAGNTTVNIYLIKNFGTGGSTSTETQLASLTITTGGGVVQTTFPFGDNAGQTIGANNDDFIQLAIRLPTASIYNVSFDDFILTPGTVTLVNFPQTPNSEFHYKSISGFMPTPAYDSSSLYLPLKLTQAGLTFDDSEVGEVIAESNLSNYINSLHPTSNKILADGSEYERLGYSPLGIPYNRLFQKYWNSTLDMPQYGTGLSYFLSVLTNTTNQIILTNNSPGIVTATADGAIPTGFTFSTVYTAIAPASGYYCSVIQNRTDGFYIIDNEAGGVGAGGAGTAPVTTSVFRTGTGTLVQITSFAVTGSIGPGQYFTFQTSHGGTQNWYVWFKVDGTGTDPAIGGRTGILVNLHSGDDNATVAKKITTALNNWQTSSIVTTAASSVTTGSYFTANAITPGGTPVEFYVWYKKDGTGTDPKPGGKIGVEVDILSADTAAQVATKTQIAINQKYFAVPDLRGQFLRGWNNGSGIDPDTISRYSLHAIGLIGDQIGTREFDEIISHLHSISTASTTSQAGAGATINVVVGGSTDTTSTGGIETRPINIYVNYAIRY